VKDERREDQDGGVVGEDRADDGPAQKEKRKEPGAAAAGVPGQAPGQDLEEARLLGHERDHHQARDRQDRERQQPDSRQGLRRGHQPEGQRQEGAQHGRHRMLDAEPADLRPAEREPDRQGEDRERGDLFHDGCPILSKPPSAIMRCP
jgi:hypothetical protein